MAKFAAELPNDILKSVERLEKDSERMMGEMTQAGADTVVSHIKSSAPAGLGSHVKTTKVYKTPSDDGINTKVYMSGYLPFKPPRKTFSRGGGSGKQYSTTKGIPAAFLANLFEYGRSTAPFPKKPFFRKSFKKGEIEKAMLSVQNKYIK